MRSSLFVSALFVGTLLAGTAAAERKDNDESRPRVSERNHGTTDKQRSERSERAERNVRKVEASHRYQDKTNVPTAKEQAASKLQMVLRLPKQSQERARCETGNEECTSSTTDHKRATTNADRGVRKVEANKTTSQRGKAAAPNAAERAILQRVMNAKCSASARGGCTGDGSDSF